MMKTLTKVAACFLVVSTILIRMVEAKEAAPIRQASVSAQELRHDTQGRPNIVYIALEDITPMFGCYGDSYAKTPHFDKLAEETKSPSANWMCCWETKRNER